jgi:putative hydrolases of HD superfamily
VIDAKTILEFMSFAEGLKNVLRHSYTSAGRRESVAEHSWMLTLLAILVFDDLSIEVDRLKVLKLLIVHDLPEIITGDIPVFHKLKVIEQAHADEVAAIDQMVMILPKPLRSEIKDLCLEYNNRQSIEARLAYAIDKAEALIQHNIEDISTWDQNDFDYQTDFSQVRQQPFQLDPFIAALKQQIDTDSMNKISGAGLLERARTEAVQWFHGG